MGLFRRRLSKTSPASQARRPPQTAVRFVTRTPGEVNLWAVAREVENRMRELHGEEALAEPRSRVARELREYTYVWRGDIVEVLAEVCDHVRMTRYAGCDIEVEFRVTGAAIEVLPSPVVPEPPKPKTPFWKDTTFDDARALAEELERDIDNIDNIDGEDDDDE